MFSENEGLHSGRQAPVAPSAEDRLPPHTTQAEGWTGSGFPNSPVPPAAGPGDGPAVPDRPGWGGGSSVPVPPVAGPGDGPALPDRPGWGGGSSVPVPPVAGPGDGPALPDRPGWGGGSSVPVPPVAGPGDGPAVPGWPDWGGGSSVPVPPVAGPGDGPAVPDRPGWRPPITPIPILPGTSNIRFLYAAVNQPPVNIQLGGRRVINHFRYGNVTPYYRQASGSRTITITSAAIPGLVLYRAIFTFLPGVSYTLSLVNSGLSISVFSLEDRPCQNWLGSGCIRAVNLSSNSGPVDVFLSGNGRIFSGIPFRNVSSFIRIPAGTYRAYASRALACAGNQAFLMNESTISCNAMRAPVLDSATVNMRSGIMTTLYIVGNANGFPSVQIMAVESD